MTQAGSYRAAGVDLEAQDRALTQIKKLARSTFTPEVLSDVGLFGGLFRLPLEGMKEPVLVASADGVGTKLSVARLAGDFSTVGTDLVNHCVNDILVQGAQPLFFLDYVGAGVLEPGATVSLVEGVRGGCKENSCALLGGELAEMPGFYQAGDYELVGFIVGMVDRPSILDGSRVKVGDILIGLPSSGLHTNGYSLARKILLEDAGLGLSDPLPGTRLEVGRSLLAPPPFLSFDAAPGARSSGPARSRSHHRGRHHRQPASSALAPHARGGQDRLLGSSADLSCLAGAGRRAHRRDVSGFQYGSRDGRHRGAGEFGRDPSAAGQGKEQGIRDGQRNEGRLRRGSTTSVRNPSEEA